MLPSIIVLSVHPVLVWGIVLVALVWCTFRILFRKNLTDAMGNRLPPGPLLRYAFLRKYPERSLHAWAQKFGPIFSVWMGSQLFVVINDPVIARDLLVVHGGNFSSRWSYFMKNVTILRGGAVTAAPYNDTWRKHRRISVQALTPKALQGYMSIIDFETWEFVRSLSRATKGGTMAVNPAPFAGRYAFNNMLAITFGTRTNSEMDPLLPRALRLAQEFMLLTGEWSNMIDFIKPLQWIPSRMRTRGRKLHDDFVELYGSMILETKRRMESGEQVADCLVKSLLESQEKEELSWEDMSFICTAFTTGGVHPTAGVIEWLFALMPSHPHIQSRAHEELDRVIGRERFPTAEDEPNLQYIRAIIKEVFRMHCPSWMATPHCSDEDFVYNGMYIPKGTVMILNCYTLHHNEECYPDSWTFKPERYLDDHLSSFESSKLSNPLERDHWAFGAGRRICPGMRIAEHELFLAISRILWMFKIEASADDPIISLEEYEGNSGRTLKPFKVKLVPRRANALEFLEDSDQD